MIQFQEFEHIRFPDEHNCFSEDVTIAKTDILDDGKLLSPMSSFYFSGSCAQGFGACCTILVDDCTSSNFQKNLTYIVNPSYPSTYSSSSATCKYTLSKVVSKVVKPKSRSEGHFWHLHDPPRLCWWNHLGARRYQISCNCTSNILLYSTAVIKS